MNSIQRSVLFVGVGLIFLAGLFPPWISQEGSFLQFGWLFSQPPIEPMRIDIARILVEWVTLVLVSAGLVLALADRRAS